MRLLILGGTSEARAFAGLVGADRRFDPLLSLAGRTSAPMTHPVPTRIGGFGGASGLARFLEKKRIEAVIDATHPFAANISANAVAAANAAGVPLGSIVRAPWRPEAGDRWTGVANMAAAARALGDAPRRVFLTVGRLELAAFAAAPQHDYVARTIDPSDDAALPPRIALIHARPPFDAEAEAAFLAREKIDVLVSKNSGSPETFAKIEAARRLGLPVVMVERPEKPAGERLANPSDAFRWLESLLPHARSARGV